MNETIRRSNRFLVGEKRSAVYQECEEPLHQHNCYIEALPKILTPLEVAKRVTRQPFYDPKERLLSAEQRLAAVHRIVHCVFAMPVLLELEQKMSRLIRNGYANRNPIRKEMLRQLKSGFVGLIEGDPTGDEPIPLLRVYADAIGVFGMSGVGKSTVVDSILGLYPQVIIHTEYRETPFDQQQLVWLKLECPFDGSLRGLCMSFFEAVDEVVGTRYAIQYRSGRRSANELLPIMAKIAASLALGVLVIDEIQRLNEAASGGAQKMLNFFVELTNTISVPIILVGTFKALHLFQRELAMGRRISGQGDVNISNLKKDESWDHFLKKLWRYQWTKDPSQLDDKLNEAMYVESQGIVDIGVKLYMLTQWNLIGSGNEMITPARIRAVAKDSFHAIRPILQALRDHDLPALAKIPDVLPRPSDMERFFNAARQRVVFSGTVDTLANNVQQNLEDLDELLQSPISQITALLIGAGYPVDLSQKWAESSVQRHANASDIRLATSDAFRLAAEHIAKENSQPNQPPKRAKAAKVISLSGDLRAIAAKAMKEKRSVYELLVEEGVTRPASEFFDEVVT